MLDHIDGTAILITESTIIEMAIMSEIIVRVMMERGGAAILKLDLELEMNVIVLKFKFESLEREKKIKTRTQSC